MFPPQFHDWVIHSEKLQFCNVQLRASVHRFQSSSFYSQFRHFVAGSFCSWSVRTIKDAAGRRAGSGREKERAPSN